MIDRIENIREHIIDLQDKLEWLDEDLSDVGIIEEVSLVIEKIQHEFSYLDIRPVTDISNNLQ